MVQTRTWTASQTPKPMLTKELAAELRLVVATRDVSVTIPVESGD
jgi:hypothetical protein